MKIIIAIDSFKGSLSSLEAGHAVKEGLLQAMPQAHAEVYPLADGGEGTVDALVSGMNGVYQKVVCSGPLGAPVEGVYGILEDKTTCIMEMSAVAGITLIPAEAKNPMKASTYGVGEMINHALDLGCRKFIMGIGGSATNDGGVGMLQALGFSFLDEQGKEIPRGAEGLVKLHSVNIEQRRKELDQSTFHIACDVNNPLCGTTGASHIYGPQKGASPEMVLTLDELLGKYADITQEALGKDWRNHEGAGAAGGMGFAFTSYLKGTLTQGVELILNEIHLEEYLKDADIVVTGEGMLDMQTAMGKAPVGVAKLAKKHNNQVIAFAGGVTADAVKCNEEGIDAFFSIQNRCIPLEEAMTTEVARYNLTRVACQVFRLIAASK